MCTQYCFQDTWKDNNVSCVCVCVNKEDGSREKRNERARENKKRRVQQ